MNKNLMFSYHGILNVVKQILKKIGKKKLAINYNEA